MEMIHALCCLLLPVTVAFARRPARGAHALAGTWRVLEFSDLDKDGKWQYRFGEHPRGYFVYDATGHVHIQIMKVPPLRLFQKRTPSTVSCPPPSMPSPLMPLMSHTSAPTPWTQRSMW